MAQFAILLKDSPVVDPEALKRAFRSLSNLTDADATRIAVQTRGILVKRQTWDAARGLQLALQSEGIATAIVDEQVLPRLPAPRFIRRLEFTGQTLQILDPIGRTVPVDWNLIQLLAAGIVRHFAVSETRSDQQYVGFSPMRGLHLKTVTDVRHKVEDEAQLVLDIVMANGAMRFQTEAAQFLFKPLIDDEQLPLPDKFAWLVRELCERAPGALPNRGAFECRAGGRCTAAYPSKVALADESVWLLWRLAESRHRSAS
jgi:hypothetical protein